MFPPLHRTIKRSSYNFQQHRSSNSRKLKTVQMKINLLLYLQLSVALSIFKHVQKELCTLLGPASLSPAELFGLNKRKKQMLNILLCEQKSQLS